MAPLPDDSPMSNLLDKLKPETRTPHNPAPKAEPERTRFQIPNMPRFTERK